MRQFAEAASGNPELASPTDSFAPQKSAYKRELQLTTERTEPQRFNRTEERDCQELHLLGVSMFHLEQLRHSFVFHPCDSVSSVVQMQESGQGLASSSLRRFHHGRERLQRISFKTIVDVDKCFGLCAWHSAATD